MGGTVRSVHHRNFLLQHQCSDDKLFCKHSDNLTDMRQHSFKLDQQDKLTCTCAENTPPKKSIAEMEYLSQIRSKGKLTCSFSFMDLCTMCFYLFLIFPADGFNLDVTKTIYHSDGDIASRFGFTVSQFYEDNQDWLLVGAPEAATNQAGVTRPGAVYKCPINNGTNCQLIPFDTSGQDMYNGRVVGNKTLQWFGASMDSSTGSGYVVACAPRYVYFTQRFDKREPIGSCFLYKKSTPIKKYYPCKTESSRARSQGQLKTMSQAGMAVMLGQDKIIVGAVGSYYWQGQILIQDIDRPSSVDETPEAHQDYDGSYRGYALTMGHFDNDRVQDIAVSSPKTETHLGMVQLFRRNPLVNFYNITGRGQVGEFFGYCLSTGDFNNDGRDDLVVGAPLYMDEASGSYEMGRTYVFLQTANAAGPFQDSTIIQGEKERSARFGSAAAGIGDINGDLFDDLAVGAPYADGGRGRVYIYQGSRDGIIPQYSQILKAESISSTLQSFGYSLSGGLDQDKNQYPDLLVGAQESAEIVLFRARPVIQVTPTFSTSIEKINLEKKDCATGSGAKETCYIFDTCLRYTGKGTPATITIRAHWTLDYTKRLQDSRLYVVKNNRRHRTIQKDVELNKGLRKCEQMKVFLQEDVRDKLNLIWTQLNYSLVEPNLRADEIPPILDYFQNTVHKTSIGIQNRCGDDEICIPDLKLAVEMLTPSYVYGMEEELDIEVTVENLGEGAYESTLYIEMPKGINYINIRQNSTKIPVVCGALAGSNVGKESLMCDVGNPLPGQQTVQFVIRTLPQKVDRNVTSLEFDFVVNSTNAENTTDMVNNMVHSELNLKTVLELTMEGVSVPEQVLFNMSMESNELKTQGDVGPSFLHRYVLTNKGPSSLSEINTTIYWPESFDGNVIFFLSGEPRVVEGEGRCQANITSVDNVKSQTYEREEDEGLLESSIRAIFGGKSNDKDKIFTVMCSKERFDHCKPITCTTGAMEPDQTTVIEITGRVYVKTAAAILKLYRGVNATSYAVSEVTSYPYLIMPNKNHTMSRQVETFATSLDIGAGTEPLQWWIIAVAVVGGVILLVLLVIGLWKCGFFRRKKFEDEERLTKDEPTLQATVAPTNGMQANPPRIQVDPDSKALFNSTPDDNFSN